MTSPSAPTEAIQRLVDYNWADEERDYLEQDLDGRRRHIFLDLLTIKRWLDMTAKRVSVRVSLMDIAAEQGWTIHAGTNALRLTKGEHVVRVATDPHGQVTDASFDGETEPGPRLADTVCAWLLLY